MNKKNIFGFIFCVLCVCFAIWAYSPYGELWAYKVRYTINKDYESLMAVVNQIYIADESNHGIYDEKTYIKTAEKYFPIALDDKESFLKYNDEEFFGELSAQYLIVLLRSNQFENYNKAFDKYYNQIFDKFNSNVDFALVYISYLQASKFTDKQIDVMLDKFIEYEAKSTNDGQRFILYRIESDIYNKLGNQEKINEVSQKMTSLYRN